MLTISSHFIYGPNALDNIKDAIPFLICGLIVEKNNDGISLHCGIDTTITIDPRCKKARRMIMCWFLKHRFAQHKVNWIKGSSFSLFITLKISNARRTTINEFMNMDHEINCRIIGRLVGVNLESMQWCDACFFCNQRVNFVGPQSNCVFCRNKNLPPKKCMSLKVTIKDKSETIDFTLWDKQIDFLLPMYKSVLQYDNVEDCKIHVRYSKHV
ncbi:hypothetical protein BVRB_5g107620 [Beta vulgaris subsp. vulgaris]|nr:hypothetical protein BVRB_5g107620 [Beta vulgaris subsp. vulgaris]